MRDILTIETTANAAELQNKLASMSDAELDRRFSAWCQPYRLRERIANASKLRDGGEMFLDLAECER